jgi:manganese-dependent inorganic pyrophosphatase
MADTVYITGHKNPDTDSICAAIAYAELKRKLGINAIPVRLGDINKETEFVLEYFNIPAPEYLATVRTQLSDLDIDIISPAWPEVSIKTAWTIMKKNNVKVIPVVDENEKFLGLVTTSDITKKYMDMLENDIIAYSKTPLMNIVETLNAKLICGSQKDFNTTGRVVMPAMNPEEMGAFVSKGDIVIDGSKKETQIKAIELGANCLIVTYNGSVDEEVVELARKNKCILMIAPGDTFTTARLINQSIPVGYVMTSTNVVSFNINDFVDDIKDEMLRTRFRSYPVLDDEQKVRGFISRYHLISRKRKKVILVDHNERSQTVDGIEQAEILEIIDHHRIGDIQTGYPVYFKNEPVGSTSTIITNLYFDKGIRPSKNIAGILCAAIISDTIKFKSPTCTPMDINTAQKLSEIAELDIDRFASEMFRRGSSLRGKSLEKILYNDFKEVRLGKFKFGVGQINASDRESLSEIKDDLIKYMNDICTFKDYDLLILLVTDIINVGSEVLFAGREKSIAQKAFNVGAGEDSVYLNGVVSRKMQIIPQLAAAVQ